MTMNFMINNVNHSGEYSSNQSIKSIHFQIHDTRKFFVAERD